MSYNDFMLPFSTLYSTCPMDLPWCPPPFLVSGPITPIIHHQERYDAPLATLSPVTSLCPLPLSFFCFFTCETLSHPRRLRTTLTFSLNLTFSYYQVESPSPASVTHDFRSYYWNALTTWHCPYLVTWLNPDPWATLGQDGCYLYVLSPQDSL